MFNFFVNVFKNKELRNKIIFAIVIIIVCRLLADIPIG